MSESARYVEETIRVLFRTQKLAVLSTHNSGQPYASLVAFVASEDLKHLYFATARTTRKYHNLDLDPRVAMLMDSRSNLDSDIHTAVAVTATGTSAEVREQGGANDHRSYSPGIHHLLLSSMRPLTSDL